MAMKRSKDACRLHDTGAAPEAFGKRPYSAKSSPVEAMYSGRTSGKSADPHKQARSDLNTSGSSFAKGVRRTVGGI
jgi:hypothetical protein